MMNTSVLNLSTGTKLVLPTSQGLILKPVEEVLYFSANNVYSQLTLSCGKVINVLASLTELELQICGEDFVRIHKKYIVSLHKITLYSKSEGGYIILENDTQLPVSRFRKEEFRGRLLLR